ncbi:hypothetical protein TNCV_3255121 [Trichonephila clavipes]|nr:hypothetical protein TNCV_3255121 [Trichonephila clavipes]
MVSLGDKFFFYYSLADFFGGVEPPEQPTSLCSVDASVTSSGRHTYDHRTLFWYWNSFIPQLPESTERRKSTLITDGLQSLEADGPTNLEQPTLNHVQSDTMVSAVLADLTRALQGTNRESGSVMEESEK